MRRGLETKRDFSLAIIPTPGRSIVPDRELSLPEIIQYGFPHSTFPAHIRKWKLRNLPNLWRGLKRETAARLVGVAHLSGHVCMAQIAPDGKRDDYGLVSMRVITTVAAEQVVAAFRGLYTLDNFHFHALGSGSSAESISNTALDNEHSSLYPTPGTRPTGTQQIGSSSRIFRTVATIELTNTVSIAEYGLFSQAATGGGYLFDRALVTPQTVITGFSVQCDYRLTVVSGS